MKNTMGNSKSFLLFSDFDQTLSFHDSGNVLSDILGVSNFQDRVAGLSSIHLVQQGGELAYLLLHDPNSASAERGSDRGRQAHPPQGDIALLSHVLRDLDGHHFSFYVVSAAPQEVIESALEGIVDPDHIFGTRFRYHPNRVRSNPFVRLPAGYGKVAVVEELRAALHIGYDRLVYVGDGSSDLHVMLHVNRLDGLTYRGLRKPLHHAGRLAHHLERDALSVLVPILEDVLGWDSARVRMFCRIPRLCLGEWDKIRKRHHYPLSRARRRGPCK